MKKLILTAVVVAGMSASTFAQGTINADNLNGAGNNHSTAFGLFFDAAGVGYQAGNINVVIYGGGAFTQAGSYTGANMWNPFGGGQFASPDGLTIALPNSPAGAAATVRLTAWIGGAADYASALATDKFYAWNGSAFQDASTFSFSNNTGGVGVPPSFAQSLDGMPAMQLGSAVVPEPSTLALAGLGAAALLAYRRRKN